MSFWSRLRGIEGSLLVAFVATLSLLISGLLLQPRGADAARNDRTLSLYEIHTKETTTVTFKRNGRYVPAALKKLNWAMRDWRTNVATKMDPKLFDLVWELQQEMGSKKPIHVISGHRSAKTNRKLRRRGGGQAKKSQHILGHAMDIHFPDINMRKVRNSALVRERGGVGYYPTSAIPFIHVDTARVRAWPRLPRRELAMLFPHGATKHRPSSGGPLTGRDRKKARVRLAMLTRKNKTRTLLANASVPGRNSTLASGSSTAGRPVVLASLGNNGFGTLAIPKLLNHAAQLWINKAGNSALPKAQPAVNRLPQGTYAKNVTTRGQTFAKSRWTRPREQKATLQLASLSPQKNLLARPSHQSNLWVNSAGLSTSWMSENGNVTSQQKTVSKRKPPKTSPREFASLAPAESLGPQKPVQQKFGAERVAYAPAFDEEHPDELSYRPFQILPLMSSKPVAQNKTLVAMVEPKYNRIYELLASSENIPMQFRPSSREAEMMWNNQFKGNAIVNIRKQAESIHLPTRPRRMAKR